VVVMPALRHGDFKARDSIAKIGPSHDAGFLKFA
jgi:hypothetical protein